MGQVLMKCSENIISFFPSLVSVGCRYSHRPRPRSLPSSRDTHRGEAEMLSAQWGDYASRAFAAILIMRQWLLTHALGQSQPQGLSLSGVLAVLW